MTALPRSPGARAGLYLLAAILGLAVLLRAVNAFYPSQHGPISSSYATTPGGLAAYGELLTRAGHRVTQLRQPPAAALLDPDQTLVMLDPDALLAPDGRALSAFVAAGGTLLTGGTLANSFLATILPRPPLVIACCPAAGGPALPRAAVTQTAGVGQVAGAGAGWSAVAAGAGGAALRPVLAAAGAPPLLLVGRLGRGQIELLADGAPLQNQLLARADNARLGINLAGPAGRPVVFIESVHGYGLARGLAALPARWWWAAGGLGLGAVAFAASRWRRLGPPSRRDRTLPPARSAYLQAMTTILRRTDDHSSIGRLARANGRRLLARRLGLGADAGVQQQHAGALRIGLSPAEAAALVDERPPGADDLLVLGAALARLAPTAAPTAAATAVDRAAAQVGRPV